MVDESVHDEVCERAALARAAYALTETFLSSGGVSPQASAMGSSCSLLRAGQAAARSPAGSASSACNTARGRLSRVQRNRSLGSSLVAPTAANQAFTQDAGKPGQIISAISGLP